MVHSHSHHSLHIRTANIPDSGRNMGLGMDMVHIHSIDDDVALQRQ